MKKWMMLWSVLASIVIAWFGSKILLWFANTATNDEYLTLLTDPKCQYILFVVMFAGGLPIAIKSVQRYMNSQTMNQEDVQVGKIWKRKDGRLLKRSL